MAKGGKRAGSGNKPGVHYAIPSVVVGSRVGEWALPTLEERAKANDISLSAYVGQLLEGAARRNGASAPPKYKPARHKASPRKRPTRAALAAAECAPEAPCSYAVTGGRCTITASVIVPAKGGSIGIEKIPARYCVVEASQLLTSHNPLGGFAPRRGYPEDAQERDYQQQEEQGKVLKIAQNFEPSLIFSTAPGALDGLPVATEDRFVLGGNGRAMALQLIYAGEGGSSPDAPRQYLLENAKQFGLTKKDILKFKAPVVVRTIRTADSSPRTLAEWSRRLNASLSQQLDPVALAVSRAKFIGPTVLEHLNNIGIDETLSEYLASEPSREFVRALQSAGVIDSRSGSLYLNKNGLLNPDGKELVVGLLVARILPSTRDINAIGPQVIGTLSRSAYYLIATENLGAYSLLPPLRAAVEDRLTMRAIGETDLNFYLRQPNLFGKRSQLHSMMLEILYQTEDSPVRFARVTKKYLQLAKSAGQGQTGFSFGSLSPTEALAEAAKEAKIKFV